MKDQAPASPVQGQSRPSFSLLGVPFLFAGILLSLLIGLAAGFLFNGCGKLASLLGGPWLSLRSSDQTLYASAITELKKTPKLVLSTAELEVTVIRHHSGEVVVLGQTISTGECLVTIVARGNKVQFVVPLEELKPSAFRRDGSRQHIVLRLPSPKADTGMIVAQNDRNRMQIHAVSSRLMSRSDEEKLIQDAVNNLKPEILRRVLYDANLRLRIQAEARAVLLEILGRFQERLPPGYTFETEFTDGAATIPSNRQD